MVYSGIHCAWLLCVALAWGCFGSSEERCHFQGDFGQGTLIDYRPDTIHIVDTGSVPKLFVFAGRTWEWHDIEADGSIGPALGRSTLDLYEGLFSPRGVMAWDSGFRILAGRASKYAESHKSVDVRPYVWMGSPLLSRVSVWKSFWVRGALYVTWTAMESAGPPEVQIGGLARLERDERLIPIGEPFIRMTKKSSEGRDLALEAGAWDEEGGYFLIDQAEDDLRYRVAKVYKVALGGTVLDVAPVMGDAPILYDWVKLNSGTWAALHGSCWLWFTPEDRRLDVTRRYMIPQLSTQGRDSAGNLWLAGAENGEVALRRWDAKCGQLTDPVRSPLPVKTCALLYGLL